jgi:hypothetical protein
MTYCDQGLGGYKPILTDLGGAYCKQAESEVTYPVAYTPNYFDPITIDLLFFQI